MRENRDDAALTRALDLGIHPRATANGAFRATDGPGPSRQLSDVAGLAGPFVPKRGDLATRSQYEDRLAIALEYHSRKVNSGRGRG